MSGGGPGRVVLAFPVGPLSCVGVGRLRSPDPGTRVIPGHGPETTIARARRANPFLRGL